MTNSTPHTINIVAAALGGEGGGVFTNWIIDVAALNNWVCQTTSLAGVAQRTGATIYYIELIQNSGSESKPVMSLFPAQGDIDVVVTTEIAEAGRMMQRGFVSKDRTSVITSTHRVYGITEKIDLTDGTIDSQAILQIAQKYAKSLLSYDMASIASEHNSVISAVLFGALAGSDALPFPKTSYTQVIEQTGKSISTNLAAFEASYQTAKSHGVGHYSPTNSKEDRAAVKFQLPDTATQRGQPLLEQIRRLPEPAHHLAYLGTQRLIEYQDIRYATQYLNRLSEIAQLDVGDDTFDLTTDVARYLALWMSFEDIPRVAQQKIRTHRENSIREEVQAENGQIITVAEYFSPQLEEVCGMLPRRLGAWVLSYPINKIMAFFMGGRKLKTNTVSIFAVLRILASLRHIRRGSLGYHLEHKQIDNWLTAIIEYAPTNLEVAQELAKCGRMIKGYSHTRRRTTAQLASIISATSAETSALQISEWRTAALANDEDSQIVH
ncbi:MAG: indolepyruvate oxidoreductase subunit beta family protein [Gammaproteobacteria bacterium]|nr:indolepyruvate oxidoreductase subunit beta family protein [Gammaproteobacteria bacterium]